MDFFERILEKYDYRRIESKAIYQSRDDVLLRFFWRNTCFEVPRLKTIT